MNFKMFEINRNRKFFSIFVFKLLIGFNLIIWIVIRFFLGKKKLKVIENRINIVIYFLIYCEIEERINIIFYFFWVFLFGNNYVCRGWL